MAVTQSLHRLAQIDHVWFTATNRAAEELGMEAYESLSLKFIRRTKQIIHKAINKNRKLIEKHMGNGFNDDTVARFADEVYLRFEDHMLCRSIVRDTMIFDTDTRSVRVANLAFERPPFKLRLSNKDEENWRERAKELAEKSKKDVERTRRRNERSRA